MKVFRRHPYAVVIGLFAAIAITTGFTWPDEEDYYYKINKGLEVFGEIYREIATSYVDQVDPDAFTDAAIDGMLGILDPYTVYLPGHEANDIEMLTTGSYGGIGISVSVRDSMLTIVDVLDNSPAAQAGLRLGDRIYAIDGTVLLHAPLDSLHNYTRGQPQTSMKLDILRDEQEPPLARTLLRKDIKVRSVTYYSMLDDGVGYIRLERFGARAGDEVRSALLELKRQNLLRSIVLDLRDNPGGILEAAVDVTSQFVPLGSVIVTTRGRGFDQERVYRSDKEPIAEDLALVVLVNENSASAAEIVAGAVQDLDAGVVMGTQSFGKGLVQSMRQLSHDAQLKITTARYFTPSGRCIQKVDYFDHNIAGRHADSTPASFHTRRGRLVFERGGILPDSIVDGPDTTTMLWALQRNGALFNFASRTAARYDSLPPSFRIDDATLHRFEAYIADSIAPLGALARLNALENEIRDSEARSALKTVRQALRREQMEELAKEREAIRTALQNAVADRFRSRAGRIAAELHEDDQLDAARTLLQSDGYSYERILRMH